MMNQKVEEVTRKLLSRLPGDKKPVPVSELQAYEFPVFLVDEIKNMVNTRFTNSVAPTETDWADTESEQVKKEWGNYLNSLKENLHIPADQTEIIVKSAVDNVLSLVITPLQTIPSTLFREDEELSAQEINRRAKAIRVHSHLITALVRYIQKREIETVSEKKAGEILRKIDQKLTEKFNALHWAHYMRPLFDLAGPNVESDLIRQFFEERGKHRFAKKFDELEDRVSESDFIVALSSSDTLEYAGQEEDQPSLFTSGKEGGSDEENKADQEEDSAKEKVSEDAEQYDEPADLNRAPWEDEAGDENGHEKPAEDTDEELEVEEPIESETNKTISDKEMKEPEDGEEPASKTESEPVAIEEPLADEDEEEREQETAKGKDELDPDKKSISEEYSFRGTNITDEEEEGETSLYSRFIFDEENAEDQEEQEEARTTIYDEMELVREDDAEEKKSVLSLFEMKETEIPDEDEETSTEEKEDENEPEDKKTLSNPVQSEVDTEEDEPVDEEEEEAFGVYAEDIADSDEDEEENESISRYFSEETELPEDNADNLEDENDVPMWKSFLEREEFEEEDTEELQKSEQQEELDTESDLEDEPVDEDGFIDEPIIDLTREEDPDSKIETVENWLSDDRERFVGSIFSGSDMAYETVLSEIIDFNDWKSASRYIEKEIFSRNMVDLYDEDAIDFTDRLHNYFKEFKS